MPSIRISLIQNQNQQNKSVVLVNKPTLAEILSLAKNKLRMKSKLVFSKYGNELSNDQELSEYCEIETDLFISAGEGFIGNVSNQPVLQQASIKIIASVSFIDQEAVSQLKTTATLPGIKHAIGMPDLHPGNKFPIGCVFSSEAIIYPALIGGDIGCGMSLYSLDGCKNLSAEAISKALYGIEGEYDGDLSEFTGKLELGTPTYGLGTVGTGNHFVEFQLIEQVVNEQLFNLHSLDSSCGYLLIHSGSRGLGQGILDRYTSEHGSKGVELNSEVGRAYLKEHDNAVEWAKANRKLIKHRVLERVGITNSSLVLDITHNSVVEKEWANGLQYLLHRKGAAPSDQGLIVIPGSRGDYSILVCPIGSQEANGYSVAHGAGRKLSRSKATAVMRQKYGKSDRAVKELQSTRFGGKVICEDKNLMLEESPEAYKDVSGIVEDLKGIVEVVAILKPVCTYKYRKDE